MLNFSLRTTRPSANHAFTLVELLVVISICSLMLLLIAPAVQAAREAARRCECKNNLKQLALACHSHHDVHGHFPTGGWGWFWTGDADRGFGKDQPGGWIFNSLPYFEQYALYDAASDGNPHQLTDKQMQGTAIIVQTPLSVINCPSRRANLTYPMVASETKDKGFVNSLTPTMAGRSDYAINSGPAYNQWTISNLGRGPRSYQEADVWTAGRFWGIDQVPFGKEIDAKYAMSGLSHERSMVRLRQVTRGLSQTYLLGERHIPEADYETGLNYGDNETWCTGFNNDNYRTTGRVSQNEIVEALPIPDNSVGMPLTYARFGSAHTETWNAAFCDGSVHSVNYDLDWRLHRDTGIRTAP